MERGEGDEASGGPWAFYPITRPTSHRIRAHLVSEARRPFLPLRIASPWRRRRVTTSTNSSLLHLRLLLLLTGAAAISGHQMEVFQVAHYVRLRSSVRSSRYLAAADDGQSVFLCGRRGVHNAVWAVEPVIGVIPGASAGPYVRLRGAYGRYLMATNYDAGRGPSDGVIAEQRDLGVRPTPPGYLWQAFRRRDSFVLRNGAGRYLRANGRFRRWHKDVSVAGDNASTMMQWRVEVVPPMASRPSLVDPPAQLMHRTNPPVESDLSRVIRYVRADNTGRYAEQDWAPVRVNTNNLTHLRLTLAERLGQNCDAGQITLCVRAGRYAHLSPLLVDLPMGNNPVHIVVLNHGTPAENALRYPNVEA